VRGAGGLTAACGLKNDRQPKSSHSKLSQSQVMKKAAFVFATFGSHCGTSTLEWSFVVNYVTAVVHSSEDFELHLCNYVLALQNGVEFTRV
jgi:hypothetical protein